MRIGELAQRAGVASHTIRHYERQGLIPLPRRTPGGYRDYRDDALDDLQFIRKAQSLGLRLNDIREVMEIASGGRSPCEHVRGAVRRRLDDVEARLRKLRELRATLRGVLRRLDEAPQQDAGCRCAVIESS